jgi:hypothetical protein
MHKTLSGIITVVILIQSIAVSGYSMERLSTVLSALKPTYPLSNQTRWFSDIPDGKGGRLSFSVDVDRTGFVSVSKSDIAIQITSFDDSGNTIAETNRYFGNYVDLLGFDFLAIRRSPDEKKMVIETWKSGVRTDHKETGYNRDLILMNALPYCLENLLVRGISTGFSCDILIENGITTSADVRLIDNADFLNLSKLYDFPESFRKSVSEVSSRCGGLIVFDVNFTGMVGIVFPHHFYFAFSKRPDRSFVAYYGNEPTKNASFYVRTDIR